MKKALAITHVPFEDLGSLERELLDAGYEIERCDACTADFAAFDPAAHDLAIVLGGPVGVYESESYPFLHSEIDWLRSRLARKLPTLGICLGAQLMAAALGARVYPGSNGKEIGWKPLQPGAHAVHLPALAHLLNPALPVLHWHGDTFDLPADAWHLAASDLYPNQAFAIGHFALGLQFHPEVTPTGLERWYVGHACELAKEGIDITRLREEGQKHASVLEEVARQFWRVWLSGLDLRHSSQ